SHAGGASIDPKDQASGLSRMSGGQMSLDQANALVTLSHNLDASVTSIDEMVASTRQVEQAYLDAMTAGEAFTETLHKAGSAFTEVIDQISGPITELLKKTSQ